MEFAQLLLDILVIALLGAAVYYGIRLERQLRVLRGSQAEIGRYIAEFSRNIDRAEASVRSLKQAARESGDDLETLLERAQTLRDELNFVTDHADSLVEKITTQGATLAANARTTEAARPDLTARAAERFPLRAVPESRATTAPLPEKAVLGSAEPRSRAERELLQALQGIQEKAP